MRISLIQKKALYNIKANKVFFVLYTLISVVGLLVVTTLAILSSTAGFYVKEVNYSKLNETSLLSHTDPALNFKMNIPIKVIPQVVDLNPGQYSTIKDFLSQKPFELNIELNEKKDLKEVIEISGIALSDIKVTEDTNILKLDFSNIYENANNLNIKLLSEESISRIYLIEIIPDLNSIVEVFPQTEFAVSALGQNLQINFKYPLTPSSEYKIIIDSKIESIYGDYLKEDYTYTITTSPALFTYVSLENNTKSIVETDTKNSFTNTIFINEGLLKYTQNENFVAASFQTAEGSDDIAVISRDVSKSTKYLNLSSSKVRQVELSQSQNLLLYSSYTVEFEQGFPLPTDKTRLYAFNIDTNQTYEFALPKKISQVGEFFIAPDNSTLLIEDESISEYYLVSFINPDDYVSVGNYYLQYGGFNRDSNAIAFSAFDPTGLFSLSTYLTVFSAGREAKDFASKEDYFIDPFFGNDNLVYVSNRYKEIGGIPGLFAIASVDLNSGVVKEIIKEEGKSLELPSLDPGSRYLAAELYEIDDIKDLSKQRIFPFANKPAIGKLIIYDLIKDSSFIVNGIDLKWNR